MALRRLVAILMRGGLTGGLVLAPGAAPAQFMALTPPAKAEFLPMAAPDARSPAPHQARAAAHTLTGSLPNQRTNPSRLRAVRDICIGCDR